MLELNLPTEELVQAAAIAQDAADFKRLEPLARELIARHEKSADKRLLAVGYRFLGTARHYASDARGAEAAYSRALEIAQEAGDDLEAALAMIGLGNMALEAHSDVSEGRRLHLLSEPVIRACGDKRRLAILTGNLGEIARVEGDYDRALLYAAESLDLFTEIADDARSSWQLVNIALIRALRCDYDSAFEVLTVAAEVLARAQNAYWQAMYLDVCFMLAVNLRRWDTAALLMGYASKYRDERNVPRLLGLMSMWYPPCVERLAQRPNQERFLELRLRGASLEFEQVESLIKTIRQEAS